MKLKIMPDTVTSSLGMKTSLAQLARAGWRPLALILIETTWLAALVLGFSIAANDASR